MELKIYKIYVIIPSIAMFLCAFASVFSVLFFRGGIGIAMCAVIAVLAAFVCTITEMCTKNGLDTVICPISAMVVIIPLTMLL